MDERTTEDLVRLFESACERQLCTVKVRKVQVSKVRGVAVNACLLIIQVEGLKSAGKVFTALASMVGTLEQGVPVPEQFGQIGLRRSPIPPELELTGKRRADQHLVQVSSCFMLQTSVARRAAGDGEEGHEGVEGMPTSGAAAKLCAELVERVADVLSQESSTAGLTPVPAFFPGRSGSPHQPAVIVDGLRSTFAANRLIVSVLRRLPAINTLDMIEVRNCAGKCELQGPVAVIFSEAIFGKLPQAEDEPWQ